MTWNGHNSNLLELSNHMTWNGHNSNLLELSNHDLGAYTLKHLVTKARTNLILHCIATLKINTN